MGDVDIAEMFGRLREMSNTPGEVDEVRERYLSGDTPVDRLHIGGALKDMLKFSRTIGETEAEVGFHLIQGLGGAIDSVLHSRGYRNNILTYQEHRVSGGSGLRLVENGAENPYTVEGVLAGTITPVEARIARSLNYLQGMAVGSHWGVARDEVSMMLGPIDDKGVMIGEPILVGLDGEVLSTKLVSSAPFKRDC